MIFDVLIRQGEVIDPSQNLRGVRDIGILNGLIHTVEEKIDDAEATFTVDARGLLVTPGLIDIHMHAYRGHAPLGLDPDSLCAAGGVTTMLDAGTAGSYNFEGFRRDVVERCETHIQALVNLSCIGLVAANLGELMDRRYADPDGVVKTIQENPGIAVGVKIRAGKHIIGDGEDGRANFMEAVRAARESNTWLMVHIGESPMTIPEMLEHMEPGDCITHCFKGGSTRVLDPENRVYDAVQAAAERGVVFDVGHGFGSFQWEVCQAALEQGLPPTTISTDLHVKNIHGPVYDMTTTMSKFLQLGMPLEEVIARSTSKPAAVLKQQYEIGTLKVGTVADIAVLEKREGRFVFSDSYRQERIGNELLVASTTVRRGEIIPGGGGLRMRKLAD